MGLVNASFILKNPRRPDLDPVEVEALADSGAVHLCIPESARDRLALEVSDHKEVTLADGSKKRVPYAGPIEVRFNPTYFIDALRCITEDEIRFEFLESAKPGILRGGQHYRHMLMPLVLAT